MFWLPVVVARATDCCHDCPGHVLFAGYTNTTRKKIKKWQVKYIFIYLVLISFWVFSAIRGSIDKCSICCRLIVVATRYLSALPTCTQRMRTGCWNIWWICIWNQKNVCELEFVFKCGLNSEKSNKMLAYMAFRLQNIWAQFLRAHLSFEKNCIYLCRENFTACGLIIKQFY